MHPTLDTALLEELEKLSGNDGASFLDSLIAIYIEDVERARQELGEGLAERDLERVARTAHGLRSGSLNLGAARLAALCREVDAAAREGLIDAVRTRLVALEQEIPLVLDALNRRRQQNPGD